MAPMTNTPNAKVLAKMGQPAIIPKSNLGRQQEGFQCYRIVNIRNMFMDAIKQSKKQSISVTIPHLGVDSCSKHSGSAVVG